MRSGGQMKALRRPHIREFFRLKRDQLKSVFRSSNSKAETNCPSASPPTPQDPADSLTPLGDAPSDSAPPQGSAANSAPSQDLSSVFEDNGAAELGSQLEGSRSDHEAAAVDSLLHLAGSDDEVAELRSLFRELSSISEISEAQSTLLGLCANNNAFETELGLVCHVVVRILQDLCRRDSRFIYLQEAMEEFLNEHFCLRIRILCYNQHTNSALSDNSYDQYKTIGLDLDFLSQMKDAQDAVRYRLSLLVPMAEILLSIIYEILDVFDFDIVAQESIVQRKISAYLTLLHHLYDKTKNREPKPSKQTINSLENQQHNSHFIYQTELDLATDQTRILRLDPGSGDDDIQCSLNVHSIKEDGIPEALSYVWGKELSKERILVDSQRFFITKDLFEILRSLRYPKTSRTIWIDAICINQANNKERTHQVRLMREIYSQAQKTIIYLTKADLHLIQPRQYIPPLPKNFGGTTMDQFDLESILREFQEYPNDAEKPWCERQLVLFMMFSWCVHHIFSCAWWERIWTLQEGALAKSPPIVVFQGHSCTFQALQSVCNISYDMQNWSRDQRSHFLDPIKHNQSKDERTREIFNTFKSLGDKGVGMYRQPLLLSLRQRHSDGSTASHLYSLLDETAAYRATDPRDKIYALESLLPRCIGKLIRIDYNEDYKITFACATARCINAQQSYNLAAKFNLLIDSTTMGNKSSVAADGEATTHPSWVLDFSYCDSDIRSNEVASNINSIVTLNGFLLHNAFKIQKSKRQVLNRMFATPTTLFCDGINIDDIDETGVIAEEGDPDLFGTVFRLAFQIYQRIQGTQANSSVGLDTVMLFLCLHLETDSYPDGDARDFFAVRLKEIVGKTYFITKNGLLGIATAPVRRGDSLCRLDRVSVYFVLRAVPDSESKSSLEAAQKHRIVARAAIRGADLPSPTASFLPCRFQII
ncbi:heterokaryon incompatibility protein-domain-containing protein [Xylaria cubensis]|nr:heterokaryon incompatibility protein-domain-containing protein [Xylaria cubensis]